MSLIKLLNGTLLAVRVWRLVIYVDSASHASLRFGGIMVNYKSKRLVARHLAGRFSFIDDEQLSSVGLL